MNKQLYTDYPILELGDVSGKPAPIREVKFLSYDGNKYATVKVGKVKTQIKTGYLFRMDKITHRKALNL